MKARIIIAGRSRVRQRKRRDGYLLLGACQVILYGRDDVLVLIGVGPSGTAMEETYQVTLALKFIPWGKTGPLLNDARFSGVPPRACMGHIGPESLAGGPIGRLREGI